MLRRLLGAALSLLIFLAPCALAEPNFFIPQPEEETPEEVVTAAMEVYSWFAMQPLDIDPYQPDSDGLRFRVLDERLNTLEGLYTAVRAVFSEEITQELLSSGVYYEEDGYLYAAEDGRAMDPTIAYVEYVATPEGDDKVLYTAAVFYSEEEGVITSINEYTSVREKIDGEWVFTDFWFFW